MLAKVRKPSVEERARLRDGPAPDRLPRAALGPAGVEALAARGVTAFALESVPRITRAQSMDALSSQATVGGYRAALLAAEQLPRFFPMLMTAAGTVPPAKVLVIGAGVAGLQAIATARRLGAVTTGFDVRPVVREQIESLGANWLDLGVTGAEAEGGYARELTPEEMQAQQPALEGRIAEFDVVITTAAVPGRPAPKIIPGSAVEAMRPGSVIVDLAAETGGNCELTEPGEIVERAGVTLVGLTNLPSTMPYHASTLLLAERPGAAPPPRAGRRARARLERRDHERRLRRRQEGGAPREPQHAARLRGDDPRARDLPRLRGDLEGADAVPHAADVGHECDPRHRHRRRDDRARRPTTRTRSPG